MPIWLQVAADGGAFSSEVLRDRRSRSTGAEGEVPQAPSNRSAVSHEDEKVPVPRQFSSAIARTADSNGGFQRRAPTAGSNGGFQQTRFTRLRKHLSTSID